MTAYNLQSLNLPKLTGTGLSLFTAAVENPASRALLIGSLLENGGIPILRQLKLDEAPTMSPLISPDGDTLIRASSFQPGPQPASFPYQTARNYAEAYRQGTLSPVEAAKSVLNAIEASDTSAAPMHAFKAVNPDDVMAQAKASEARIRAGEPCSPLDGVPVAIKDEVDMLPYPTSVGTSFLGSAPAAQDSTVAARLRAAGALLVGKTAMHEIGISPNGYNAHTGTVRNPYNEQCDTGGSSSGSGAAVAAGIIPIAIGADGGGSIRIPASVCGVVGLKPTFGRVSEYGAAPLCWSVAHLGPLAASVEDVALAYSLIAGPDSHDANTQVQPSVDLTGWNQPDLTGVRLGIDRAWFEHAAPDVVQACTEMVSQLKQCGAEVVEISIPYLNEMRIAHAVTILSEMAAAMQPYRSQRKQHGASVRLSLVLGDVFTAADYITAQKIRTRALAVFDEIYRQVDVVISPATAVSAPPFIAGGLEGGWSDLATDTELMRYAFPGNLTGLPAISFPAGYDGRGLPVGMQAMGKHWSEALLLRVAYAAEQVMARRKPARHYQIF